MRYAVYFTMPEHHELTLTGAQWLGRNAFSGNLLCQPDFPEISADEFAAGTAFARRYGFHGTIVAPFHTRDGVRKGAILDALAEFCAKRAPFHLEGLAVGELGDFVALQARPFDSALRSLASEAVEAFDTFRASLQAEELQRRNPGKLTPRQLALLERWGYPYVMEEFQFHMTLAGPLGVRVRNRFRIAAQRYFAPVLSRPVNIEGLALFSERDRGSQFTVCGFFPFEKQAD